MDIKTARQKAHMSQQELADAAGVTRVTIARYEAGERIPNAVTAVKLAAALGCTVEDLIKEDE